MGEVTAGRTFTLDGEPYTVIGVMPRGFSFPPFWHTGAGFWAPLVFTPEQAAERGARMLRVFAKLRDGRSIYDAQNEMQVVQAPVIQEEVVVVGISQGGAQVWCEILAICSSLLHKLEAGDELSGSYQLRGDENRPGPPSDFALSEVAKLHERTKRILGSGGGVASSH
jgi:hypothetical protein